MSSVAGTTVTPVGMIGDDGFSSESFLQPYSFFSSSGGYLPQLLLVISTDIGFSCLSARRRRRVGARPFSGTGWAAAPFGHGPTTYNPNYNQQAPQQNRPPGYQQGGYYGANQGYFGGQETGTELRQPESAYRGGDPVYTPPTGPPPKKGDDGIIR